MNELCLYCSRQIIGRKRQNAKFCSISCPNRFRRTTPEERICDFCGMSFKVKSKAHRFCTVTCGRKYQYQLRGEDLVGRPERDCKLCGETFKVTLKNRLYCSRKCSNQRYKLYSTVITCEGCGKSAEVSGHSKRRFCTAICANKNLARKRPAKKVKKGEAAPVESVLPPPSDCVHQWLCGRPYSVKNEGGELFEMVNGDCKLCGAHAEWVQPQFGTNETWNATVHRPRQWKHPDRPPLNEVHL